MKQLNAKPAPAPAAKPAPPAAKGPKAPRKSKTDKEAPTPHISLRCPECDYYVKTRTKYMQIARLVCPVNKAHGLLLTPEERNEKRGISAGAGK